MRRTINGAFGLVALAATVVISVPPAECQQSGGSEPALDIHGFGGWAAGYTDNDNTYPDNPAPIAGKDLEVDNYYFTLNLLARPVDRVRIHAQPTWQSTMRGRELRLDLVYAEMTLAEGLQLRAGKIKNPLGLYTEIYKVGTLRPFYLLPNAYYRLAPEGYSGLGLNRVQKLGSWELELDAFGGQMDFEPSEADAIVGLHPVNGPVYASIMSTIRGKDMVGGGALVRPPVEGLELGVSFYSMKLFGSFAGVAGEMPLDVDPQTGEQHRENAYGASIEYLTEKVSLRAEGILARGYETDDCGYVEAAYHLTSKWQIAGSYEYFKTSEPPPAAGLPPAGAQLKEHQAIGAALNYWFSPKFAWKVNYYRVTNNRAARPANAVNRVIAGTIEKDTNVVIAGVHFSF